jgi:excisionase family DNA binding protein
MEKEWLKPSEVAARLGIHRTRVYGLIRDGLLPVVYVGGAIRVPRAAWDRWLEAQTRQALMGMRGGEGGTGGGDCVECSPVGTPGDMLEEGGGEE